jgi:pimeloyl-ACP methyl ester carboxylesterase
MIMGYRGTQDYWDPTVIEMLSRKYKAITFDNRGMGATIAGTRPFTMRQFADDTAGFMDALGITKTNVLGWSMGTNTAQDLVLAYPQKVNKLVLYAADTGGPRAILPAPGSRSSREVSMESSSSSLRHSQTHGSTSSRRLRTERERKAPTTFQIECQTWRRRMGNNGSLSSIG